MAMFNDNSSLTIVLTTFNRADKLDKLLNYYFITKINYKIIISDCSKEEIILLNKKIISKYMSSLNIIHLILPNSYCIYEAFYHGLLEVETPFIVWSADDDFLIGKALAESVSFLEQNNEYVASQGKQLFFTQKNNLILFGKLTMVNNSIEGSDAKERILNTISKKDRYYSPKTVFAIMRTELTKKIYNDVLSLGLDHNNTEGLVNRLILISGKIKLLNSIYIVREHGNDNSGLVAKIRYTKIINNLYGFKSFYELNINEKTIISDKALMTKESYKESKLRIKFLSIKYILINSKLREIEAEKIFNKWFDFFSVSKNQTNNKYIDGLSLLLNTIFYNIYPFGRVKMIRKILKNEIK